MWDVKEPTHYSKRVLVVVQLGMTYMYEYAREIKLVQTRSMWQLGTEYIGAKFYV